MVPGALVVVGVVPGLVVTGFVVVGSKIQRSVKCHFHTYGSLCSIYVFWLLKSYNKFIQIW